MTSKTYLLLRNISLLLLLVIFTLSCASQNRENNQEITNSQNTVKKTVPTKKTTEKKPEKKSKTIKKIPYRKIMSKEDFLYKKNNGFNTEDIPQIEKYKMTPEKQIPEDITRPLRE